MPVIPAIGRKRQENREFKAILSYMWRLRLAWDRRRTSLGMVWRRLEMDHRYL